MTSPFVAEIRIFPFSFAPKGWAFCAGQLLPLSQNTALFSLVGTFYGGDGKVTFALPNLQGNVPIHTTQYAGTSPFGDFPIGTMGGEPAVTLLSSGTPSHSHFVNADTGVANSASPSGNVYKSGRIPGSPAVAVESYTSVAPNTALNSPTVGPAGGGLSHNNMMPYLTLNFCIALQGIYPPRT